MVPSIGMAEGPFVLTAFETETLRRVVAGIQQAHVARVLGVSFERDIETLSKAAARSEPGLLQTGSRWPVHAARASTTTQHGTGVAVCDVEALGVIVNDRTLVDCEACLIVVEERQPQCPRCHGEGVVERAATPEEVDNGHELGVAYDACPSCQPTAVVGIPRS